MPTYLFNCEQCGDFEHYQSINETKKPLCPSCQEDKVAKVFLPAGISFKGKGFYSTDK